MQPRIVRIGSLLILANAIGGCVPIRNNSPFCRGKTFLCAGVSAYNESHSFHCAPAVQ